jgi:selenocysteine lyase/cysteine desulfurase
MHLIWSKIAILPLFCYTDKSLLCSQITGMETQEIHAIRAATPGTAGRVHFNNAGSSFPPDVVVDTVTAYLREEAILGGYEMEAAYRESLENVYVSIAKLLNASAEEVAIVENASMGWQLAFNGIDFQPGDEVITSEMEYVTNLIGFLNLQNNPGIVVKVVANDTEGNFPLSALEAAISPATRLIAVTHIPSTAGNVLPVAAIGSIARKHGILYLVDACQSAGQVPLDVKEIQCDLLAATGRKYLRGPRGTGFLYVRKEIRDQLRVFLLDGHSTNWVTETGFGLRPDARRFELYEKSRALSLGLGKALDYALDLGVDRIWKRVQSLAGLLRQQLAEIPGVTVHDRGDRLCGIVTFSVAGKESKLVKEELAVRGINVSIGKASSTLLYMNKKHLTSILRASVHYYNTEDEISLLCAALRGK